MNPPPNTPKRTPGRSPVAIEVSKLWSVMSQTAALIRTTMMGKPTRAPFTTALPKARSMFSPS